DCFDISDGDYTDGCNIFNSGDHCELTNADNEKRAQAVCDQRLTHIIAKSFRQCVHEKVYAPPGATGSSGSFSGGTVQHLKDLEEKKLVPPWILAKDKGKTGGDEVLVIKNYIQDAVNRFEKEEMDKLRSAGQCNPTDPTCAATSASGSSGSTGPTGPLGPK